MSSTVRGPIETFNFSGSNKSVIQFGVNGMLYSRNRRTGQWKYAEDVGIWTPVNLNLLAHQADELEPRYKAWKRTCSKAERKAAKL